MRVGDVVPEGAHAEVGRLRGEEAVLHVAALDRAVARGPEAADGAQDGALAGTARPGDHERLAVAQHEREARDQGVGTPGRQKRDAVEPEADVVHRRRGAAAAAAAGGASLPCPCRCGRHRLQLDVAALPRPPGRGRCPVSGRSRRHLLELDGHWPRGFHLPMLLIGGRAAAVPQALPLRQSLLELPHAHGLSAQGRNGLQLAGEQRQGVHEVVEQHGRLPDVSDLDLAFEELLGHE
mmetsp:Transcript_25286/g.75478  ORF Transcript_25286/g.75478 Transcript_25286/m.75478 type:complete len:237 (-) Transcript_25286:333-1043(-)